MKKNIYLIVITIVTIVAILFGVFWHLAPAADFSLPWEHNGRSGAGSEKTTNVWEEKELGECRSISITLNAADIILEKGDQCSIRYDGNQNKIPDVKAENGKWTIDQKKKTNLHFGINNIRENKLTITLPEGMIPESATIKADAGDIKIRDIQLQKLDINADAGDIDFERDEIQDLVIDLDAGDVKADNSTIVRGEISEDAGNLTMNQINFTDLSVELDAGDAKIHSSAALDDADLDLSVDLGDLRVNDQNPGKKFRQQGASGIRLDMNIDLGDLKVSW